MKALTVQQPWAWAIVHGGKTVENRTQAWKYRGPLAIHAGQRDSARGWQQIGDLLGGPIGAAAERARSGATTYGAIIGVVQLVDVHRAATNLGDLTPCCDSEWAEQEYEEHGGATRRDVVHLVLEDPRPVDPIPCTGRLGLWTPTQDILEQLR